MNLKHACIFVLFVLLYSCSGKQQQLTQITNLEKSLYGNTKTEFNSNEAMSLVTAYYEFAKDYPEDEHSSSFLFNAGEVPELQKGIEKLLIKNKNKNNRDQIKMNYSIEKEVKSHEIIYKKCLNL